MSLSKSDEARLSTLLVETDECEANALGFASDNPFTVGLAHVNHMDGVLKRLKSEAEECEENGEEKKPIEEKIEEKSE